MKSCIPAWILFTALTALHAAGSPEEGLPQPLINPGKVYYVSNRGSDRNSGLSPEEAWETMGPLGTNPLKPGDALLFEAGGTYRLHIRPVSGLEHKWTSYGRYGEGNNPEICGSVLLKGESDWQEETPGLWRTVRPLNSDAGALYFPGDDRGSHKKWRLSDLTERDDFFYDRESGILYLYTAQTGIPPSAEAAQTAHIVDYSDRSFLLFEGLHFSKGGAHGFGGSDTHHIVIRNCEFSFIGGGYLFDDPEGKPVRFGNGVEFWGSAHNNLVESCRFREIYDTGLTNQHHGKKAVQEEIYYLDNTIENCGLASFEFWIRSPRSRMGRIYVRNNISLNPGSGWGGEERPDGNSFHIASFGNEAPADGILLEENRFITTKPPACADNRTWFHLFLYDDDEEGTVGKYLLRGNEWIMPAPLWAEKDNRKAELRLFRSLGEWTEESARVRPLTGEAP